MGLSISIGTALGNSTPTSASPPPSSGPSVGDGVLLENGTDFLLLESGDFLLLG
jgi:hypothetical protein